MEVAQDNDSANKERELLSEESDTKTFTIEDFYDQLYSQKTTSLESTLRFGDIAIPFFGLTGFSRAGATSTFVDSSSRDYYDMNVRGDFGVAAGLAVKWGKLALGYSQYRLVRAHVHTEPSEAQIQQIADVAAGTANESTVPYRDFSEFYYGGAVGHNAGLLYRFFGDDNPSAIGISVLNAGKTKFRHDAPITNKALIKLEESMQQEAKDHDIVMTLPPDIPEMVNTGVTLGWGDEDTGFRATLSVDESDIGGKHIEHKTAASAEVGVFLPDDLALATAAEIIEIKERTYHVGLLGARIFGGTRIKAYESFGGGLSFHFGYKKKISLLRLDIDAFQSRALKDQYQLFGVTGFRAAFGLALIF
jgi:hypothetical protein